MQYCDFQTRSSRVWEKTELSCFACSTAFIGRITGHQFETQEGSVNSALP
jgi:hypothetical protein